MERSHGTIAIAAACGLFCLASVLLAADEPASQTFDAKGVKIHYVTAGKGEPVVLIHGLHASSDLNWRLPGILADLARDHLVIALDLPGHGRSDKPDNEEAYGLQVVEDVVLLLDHLQIQKAHIVGYSLGGMVALKFIGLHPERVLSGTLGGMGWLREGSALQNIWERAPAREGTRTPTAFIHTIGKFALTQDELKGINVPMKVLVGDKDPVKRLYVDPLQAVRPDWPVLVIDDAGHLTCVAKPQFREELGAWVRKNTR